MGKALKESKAAKLAEAAIEEAKMNHRLAEAEHEARVEAAIEEAKMKKMEFAILKTRVWRSQCVEPGKKLAALLNDWEAMGWQLVSILEKGPVGSVTVVSARIIEQPLELPADLEEVEEATGENAPEDVATDEGEEKRKAWAEKHQAPAAADPDAPTVDSSGAVEGEDH